MITNAISRLIDLAIEEDVGTGDLTSQSLLSPSLEAHAVFIAKQDLMICGLETACEVFRRIDDNVVFETIFADGTKVSTGTIFARVSGPFSSILTAERTALNFLQRLSGIATQTARLVAIAQSSGIKLLDTRKTTPGWRELEKYAVRTGGGTNHRMGLYDQVLIKNNHLDALSCDIPKALERARANVIQITKIQGTKIEVEVRSESELRSALDAGAEALLLDNMSPGQIEKMVNIVRTELGKKNVFLEISGGISETTLESYLIPGIDAISLGMLTHSVKAVDISLHYAE